MPPETNSNDHTRLAVLETKVVYIEDTVKETNNKLNQIDCKVDGINNHIAKQNGTLPRLEVNVNALIDRLSKTEQTAAVVGTKTKIAWGLVSALVTGALMILIKIALGV